MEQQLIVMVTGCIMSHQSFQTYGVEVVGNPWAACLYVDPTSRVDPPPRCEPDSMMKGQIASYNYSQIFVPPKEDTKSTTITNDYLTINNNNLIDANI